MVRAKKMRRGQTALEYIFLIGIVAGALAVILVYMGRGVQGRTRNQADQISSKQYDPDATISNTETKRLVSNINSTTTTTVTYGNNSNRIALQNQIDDLLKYKRILERKLADLIEELKWAQVADAKAKADAFSPIGAIADLFSNIANAIGNLVTGGGSKPETTDEQWASIKTQIETNTIQTETLNATLATLDPQKASDVDQIALIKQQLQQRADEKDSLDAQLGLMVLNATDIPPEYPEYITLKDDLINQSNGSKDDAVAAINKALTDKQNLTNESIEEAGGLPSNDEAAQAKYEADQDAAENDLDAINNAINNSRPPDDANLTYITKALLRSYDSIANLSSQITATQNELSSINQQYTAALNAFNDLTINPDVTSSKNKNTENGTVTINRTTSESLGDF
jgi:hypothetical protein